MNLKGTFTAMITPFVNDRLDEEGLAKNIRRQIKAGITGLVFGGSTGESATLTEEELAQIIKIGVREAKGKALIIAGTGSNSTRTSIEKTKMAKALGADIAIAIAPYYSRPTQEGIYRHFEGIAKEVDIPLLVYNNQPRTGVNIETSTLMRIASLKNIIGVKEASGNLIQAGDVVHQIKSKHPSFAILSGDDILTLPMMALGATGVIAVISNLLPERMVALIDAALSDRFNEARKIHEELLPFIKLASIETNPIPIKEAMNLCGFPAGNCRLPLCEMRPDNQRRLADHLMQMGLKK